MSKLDEILSWTNSVIWGSNQLPPYPAPAPAPSFPLFPDFFSLAAQTTEVPPEKDKGLFETLLHGDLAPLQQDALHHPEKYDDETRELILRLLAEPGSLAKLTAEERAVLDRAVPLLAAPLPPKLPPEKPRPAPRRRAAEEDEESVRPVRGVDYLGEPALPPFFWL